MVTPKQSDPQFKLRIPQELKDRIEEAAKTNNRSLNAEMVDRLEFSFHSEDLLNRSHDRHEDLMKLVRDDQKLFDWMHAQQKTSMRIMEYIVEKDGKLEPDFLQLLRNAVGSKGQDPSFPFDDDGDPKS